MISIALPVISTRSAIAICLAAFTTVVLAWLATPKLLSIENAPRLEATVPRAFGDWTEVKSSAVPVSLSTGGDTNINQPYDQVVMRTYRNGSGQIVQLALAWGANQRQEVKIHRPDLCYVAQGFQVQKLERHVFSAVKVGAKPVVGKRMFAIDKNYGEAVSYWIRIGEIYSEDAVETRAHIFREGLAGRVPDGILVRASIRVSDGTQALMAWEITDRFLAELMDSLSGEVRAMLAR